MNLRPRRPGMWWISLVVGHRTGLRDGLGGSVHRLGLAVMAVVVTLAGWLLLSVDTVYTAQAERLAARTPTLVDGPEPGRTFARWQPRPDSVGEQYIAVVYLAPTRPGVPLPPGLPRWPQPDEAFVSPAVLNAGADIARGTGPSPDRSGRKDSPTPASCSSTCVRSQTPPSTGTSEGTTS